MALPFNPGVPQGSDPISQTQAPILQNFQSLNSAFNGTLAGSNFTKYDLQTTTANFAVKPINPHGVLHTIASSVGNPELAYINNIDSVGAGPFTGVQITGGGITAAAYVSFNGVTGAINAASAFNVSGTSRLGLGTYQINFSRNFVNTSYVALITPNMAPGGGFTIKIVAVGKLANLMQFQLQNQTNANTDAVTVDVVIFGILV